MGVHCLEQSKHDPDVLIGEQRSTSGRVTDLVASLTMVIICKLPFERKHQSSGPPTVPVPKMRISRGCAYSAARPNGAENS